MHFNNLKYWILERIWLDDKEKWYQIHRIDVKFYFIQLQSYCYNGILKCCLCLTLVLCPKLLVMYCPLWELPSYLTIPLLSLLCYLQYTNVKVCEIVVVPIDVVGVCVLSLESSFSCLHKYCFRMFITKWWEQKRNHMHIEAQRHH